MSVRSVEPWTFIHVADIQPGSPRSYRYNPSWIHNWRQARQQILDIHPDLLLVGGDLTRDGSLHRYELEEKHADLEALPFPVYVVPGNMDTGNKHTDVDGRHRGPGQCTDRELNVTSAQLQQFASVYGPLWWSVDHRGVRFSGFADVVVNSGLLEEAAFWRWAEAQAARPHAAHHVWVTHYPPFLDAPDEPDWRIDDPERYQDWYFNIDQPGRGRLLDLFVATGADLVISGHVHCHRVRCCEWPVAGGENDPESVTRGEAEGVRKGAREAREIRFEIAPATSFSQFGDRWPDGDPTLGFLRYDVDDRGITSTLVPLARTYDLEGYGPGGHPAPHARDYSLAWQRDPR